MKESRIKSFQERYRDVKNRFELIKLEKDIMDYMDTDDYNNLSSNEKDELDVLLIDIINKKEYFQACCDPWKKILVEI